MRGEVAKKRLGRRNNGDDGKRCSDLLLDVELQLILYPGYGLYMYVSRRLPNKDQSWGE